MVWIIGYVKIWLGYVNYSIFLTLLPYLPTTLKPNKVGSKSTLILVSGNN